MRKIALLAVATTVLMGPVAVHADDVVDQINEALAAYQRKDVATATIALNAALSLLRQARAESWKDFLPPAPEGWTAQPPEGSTGAEAAIVGTGTSRKYTNGTDTVEVSLLSDSPMVQALAGILTNPMVASLAGRTLVIDGRPAIYRQEDNSYTTLVADKILVRVTGGPGVTEATLTLFFQAIPFADIEHAAK